MPDASLAAALLLLLPLSAAAWHDITLRRIPDEAVIAVAGIGAGLRAAEGALPLALSLLVALLVLLLLLLPFAKGWLGGGDVKLLAALAIAVPPAATTQMLGATALAGGLLAFAYLALRRLPPSRLGRGRSLAGRVLAIERARIRRGGPLPYGVAIAIGAFCILVTGGS
jgi:prepilin peptidase CpaA